MRCSTTVLGRVALASLVSFDIALVFLNALFTIGLRLILVVLVPVFVVTPLLGNIVNLKLPLASRAFGHHSRSIRTVASLDMSPKTMVTKSVATPKLRNVTT